MPQTLAFMQQLWALVHALERRSKRMARHIGVTGPQRLVLRVLGLTPRTSAGDLAAVLHIHPSTLTGILERLVAQQLVVRTTDPRDGRRAVLQLTARGSRVNALRQGTAEDAVGQALKGVSEKECQAVRRVVQRITARLLDAGDLR